MKKNPNNQADGNWTLEIVSRKNIWDIDFVELWRYRFLIALFVRRDFVAQYKQTILGPAWHIIQPIFTAAIFLLIFGRLAGIPTDGVPPVLFYLTGITLWNYFSTTLLTASQTFVTNASIFGKVYFPRLVTPLSITLSGLIKFAIQFILVIAAMTWYAFHGYPVQPSVKWLLIPFMIALLAGISFALGIIVSSVTTKYRDISILLGFVIQLGMYATPVAYPYSFLKERSYAWVVGWNPLTSIFETFKQALFNLPLTALDELLYSVIFLVVSLILGILLFNKIERSFMDTV